MELRWLVEHSEEWHEHSEFAKKVSSEPRLQIGHEIIGIDCNTGNFIKKEIAWIDVPTVHIDI